MIQFCKLDSCANVVPASKNAGRPRTFCSARCRHRFHALAYYYREKAREQAQRKDAAR